MYPLWNDRYRADTPSPLKRYQPPLAWHLKHTLETHLLIFDVVRLYVRGVLEAKEQREIWSRGDVVAGHKLDLVAL
jgi:hypothetical protein